MMLTHAQAAVELQVSLSTIKRYCKQGKIPYAKLGGAVRIDPEHLKLFKERTTNLPKGWKV